MAYSIDRTTWVSPNHSPRTGPPTSIVVHSCEGALPSPRATSLPWLCNPNSRVSTGYYVCRDTTIFQLVDDMEQAWHAGGLQDNGTWTAQPAYSNPHSIGIECEHRSGQDWPSAQKDALAWLLRLLVARWGIAVDHIDTHGQIAIAGPYKRKVDPTNWPRPAFLAWRDQNVVIHPLRFRVRGIPVYERSDRTGPQWGCLKQDEIIEIDDMSNGHLKDGRGFIRFDPDTLEAV